MGKPYVHELSQLADTFEWSMETDVSPLVRAIASAASLPLMITGSGGSLSLAHFASYLHQYYSGRIAKAVTPLELVSSPLRFSDLGVLFLSAGGRNPDIIGAFKHLIMEEPRSIAVMCSSRESPLSLLAHKCNHVLLHEFNLPCGRDGFLATNSLLSFVVQLIRAYSTVFSLEQQFPCRLDELLHPGRSEPEFRADVRARCLKLWNRQTLVVLHGPTTQAAAFDLESKFTEAALGNVQISDYRNFAHGRHHWLAKRGSTSAVLAFVSEDDQRIADKTLDLIPEDIPVVRLDIARTGVIACITALVWVLHIVACAGESVGVDPGRPGVPPFGRRIYHLNAIPTRTRQGGFAPSHVAIQRKVGVQISELGRTGVLPGWERAYEYFMQRLLGASFKAIILDYDGTLCDGHDRYNGIGLEITAQLERVLRAGIVVGIATGRGKSVKEDLRRKISPPLWDSTFIGYYNGSEIGLLSDENLPDAVSPPCEALLPIAAMLRKHTHLLSMAHCTYRRMQITVEPSMPLSETVIWDMVQPIVQHVDVEGVTVLRSSHSADILAPGVSKRAFVQHIRHLIGGDHLTPILCIGDRGRWPGNDFDLLAEPYSLSVQEVSADPETCWNIAPVGYRGVQATVDLLNSLVFEGGSGRIRVGATKLRLAR